MIPGASSPIFMFCAPALIIGRTEGADFRFHVLRSRTRFGRYRGRRVPFSCFCAPERVFGGTEDVGSRFHGWRSWSRFDGPEGVGSRFHVSSVPRTSGPVVIFGAPGLIFGGTEGVRYRFSLSSAWNLFRRYLGRRDQFSCFALLDSFSAVPRASVPFSCFALSD
jgi:hypothetical protein